VDRTGFGIDSFDPRVVSPSHWTFGILFNLDRLVDLSLASRVEFMGPDGSVMLLEADLRVG
jgi:hypothetical protein